MYYGEIYLVYKFHRIPFIDHLVMAEYAYLKLIQGQALLMLFC